MYTGSRVFVLDTVVRTHRLGDMTIETELRSVADALASCRKRPLDPETNRVLNWATMEVHNLARQLLRIAHSLGDPEYVGKSEGLIDHPIGKVQRSEANDDRESEK